jgi:hypothetical protein
LYEVFAGELYYNKFFRKFYLEKKFQKCILGKTRREISFLLKKKIYRDLLEEPFKRLPIHLQHKSTINAIQFFDRCEIPTPVGLEKGLTYVYKKVNCSAISQIVETISFDRKCFTLFFNNEAKYDTNNYKIKRDAASNLKYLAWIRINRDFIFNGLIYVHPPKGKKKFNS